MAPWVTGAPARTGMIDAQMANNQAPIPGRERGGVPIFGSVEAEPPWGGKIINSSVSYPSCLDHRETTSARRYWTSISTSCGFLALFKSCRRH